MLRSALRPPQPPGTSQSLYPPCDAHRYPGDFTKDFFNFPLCAKSASQSCDTRLCPAFSHFFTLQRRFFLSPQSLSISSFTRLTVLTSLCFLTFLGVSRDISRRLLVGVVITDTALFREALEEGLEAVVERERELPVDLRPAFECELAGDLELERDREGDLDPFLVRALGGDLVCLGDLERDRERVRAGGEGDLSQYAFISALAAQRLLSANTLNVSL